MNMIRLCEDSIKNGKGTKADDSNFQFKKSKSAGDAEPGRTTAGSSSTVIVIVQLFRTSLKPNARMRILRKF